MTILFHPNPGTILTCDYSGLREPEMVKQRPVVIVSPRSRHNGLVTVAPLSTTAPQTILPWHYKLTLTKPLSPAWPGLTMWVKCDMLNTLGIDRLDRFHVRLGEKRKYYDRSVSPEDLAEIRRAVATFLLG